MTTCYRVSFERMVKQTIQFEIVANDPEDAALMAQASFRHVPSSEWRNDEVNAPVLRVCVPALHELALTSPVTVPAAGEE